MATDPFDQQENSNPFARALKNGLVLAPIGLAGYVGFQRVTANSALNPVAAARASLGPGRLGATGRQVGQALRQTATDSKQRLLQHAQDEIDNLLQEDGIQKLFQSVEEQRAVIQSLLDTMDDPSAGLPGEFVLSYRQKLVDIAQNTVDTPQARETVESVIRAMSDESSLTQNARARWASNLREYRQVAPYLTPPVAQLEAGQVFQPIHASELSRGTPAHRRYNDLIGALGDNGSRFVQLSQYGEGATQQIYARIYSGAGGKGAFLGSVPLSLGQDAGNRYTSLRMNENLTTGYRANRFMIDAQAAQRVFKMAGGNQVGWDQLQAGGAFVPIEDYQMREFMNRAQVGQQGLSLRGGKSAFGAWQRQTLASDARLVSSGQPFSNAGGMAAHIQQAAGFQHNFATVMNFQRMGKSAQQQLMQNLAAVQGMETGVSAGRILSRGIGQEAFGTIGIYQGSALAALQSTALGPLQAQMARPDLTAQERLALRTQMRGLFPTTARIEQVPGRESAFVGTGPARGLGRGGVFTAGATFGTTATGDIARRGANIEWANAVTGGTNKAIVLDVMESGRLYQALEGTGAAYHMGREVVREAFTKPILEPGARGGMGSALMNEVIARAKEGELVRFSRQEIKKYGGFLGIGPSGLQHLRDDPRMTGARIGYRVTEVGGKKHINIIGEIERQLETYKGFSLLHKGTLQEITAEAQRGLVGQETLDVLESLGISERHRVFAAGDMLKKGAGFFDLQMTSAYGLVTGDKGFRKTLSGLATTQQFKYLGDSHLAKVTGAVIRGLGGHVGTTTSAKEAGMVLGAIYTRGEDWVKGLNASQAVSREGIERAIRETFDEDTAGEIIRVAGKGQAIAATTFTHGLGVGDYGLGRGSVEPRFFSNLQHRLRRMGLSTQQTSDFLAGIYRNKVAYGQHLTSAQGMLKLAESVAGMSGAMDAAQMIRAGVPTYGLGDIAQMAPEMKTKGLEAFMARHQGGFMLDLTKGAATPAQRAMAAAAGDVFRQGQVFIPGAEVLGAMRGTMIKTATGSIPIEDEYSRMIASFMDDLATLSTNTERAKQSAASSMQAFKTSAIEMAGKVIHQVAGGKVRGLQAQVAAVYDITKMTGFSSTAKAQLAMNIFKKTRGMSVHMDTKGFLSQLTDFMGGTLTTEDAARKAEMFFTSLEGATDPKVLTHRARGIVGIASRHPLLSIGNVAPIQIFRHVEETGMGMADEAFSKFIQTDLGAKYANMKGFHQVADKGQKFRSQFFRDFVESMGEFAGEGGGRTFLPRRMEDIHHLGSDGKPLKVDMGISGAAIGDFDGDQYQMLMVNEDSGKTIMSTLKSSQGRSQWLNADNVYKIKSEIFTQEAKAGLKKHELEQIGKVGFADVQRIQQDLMKESASKNLVGGLDVRLNKIRTAIMDMSLQNPGMASQAEEAMALLKVVQEHAVIKGKKLPVFKAFADMLNQSVDAMFEGAGSSSLRRVMREEIFPGSALLTDEGFRVTGGTAGTVQAQEAIDTLAGGMMRLDNTLDFIDQAVNRARVTGVADYPSQARLAMGMGAEDIVEAERAFNVIRGMQTQQGSMIAGFGDDVMRNVGAMAENAISNIRSAAMRMDRKTQGLIAAGGLAALGVGAIVSNEGYSAEPIMGPMETMSRGTRNAMASGQLLQQRDHVGPRPENFQRGVNPYATAGRPVNMRDTYMTRPSSYQVRGQIYGDTGVGEIGGYMNNVSGGNVTGSVRINDARRPITQNYVDRLMGEY